VGEKAQNAEERLLKLTNPKSRPKTDSERMSWRYHVVWWLIDISVMSAVAWAMWLHRQAKQEVPGHIFWYISAFVVIYMLYGGLSNVIKVYWFRRQEQQAASKQRPK
jgi:hypothetical protein